MPREPFNAFTLDVPPSLNGLYVPVAKGRLVLSKAGRAYKEKVGWQLLSYQMTPLTGDLCVTMRIFRKQRPRDIDNFLKLSFDSFKGYVWDDDGQVTELHVYLEVDARNPRMVVVVEAKG